MFIWQLVAFLAGRGAAKSFSGLETSYRFAQLTDVHIEPFYNPERGHLKGGVCRVPEAFNKSSCVPFKASCLKSLLHLIPLILSHPP